MYRLFKGHTTPPAQSVPKVIGAMSALFGVKTARISPFFQVHFEMRPRPKEREVWWREVKVCVVWVVRSW